MEFCHYGKNVVKPVTTVSLNYEKILHTKKSDTVEPLDPDVDGVLPICIGKGTKVVEYLVDSGKIYTGEITLGFSTTTEDHSGEVVERTPLAKPFTAQKSIVQWQV